MVDSNSDSKGNQNDQSDQKNDKKNEILIDQRTKAHERARVVFDHIRSKAVRSGPFSLKPNRTVDHETDIMTSEESKKSNVNDDNADQKSSQSTSKSSSSVDQNTQQNKPSPKL